MSKMHKYWVVRGSPWNDPSLTPRPNTRSGIGRPLSPSIAGTPAGPAVPSGSPREPRLAPECIQPRGPSGSLEAARHSTNWTGSFPPPLNLPEVIFPAPPRSTDRAPDRPAGPFSGTPRAADDPAPTSAPPGPP